MKLLVDTCTFLWLAAADPQLTRAARSARFCHPCTLIRSTGD